MKRMLWLFTLLFGLFSIVGFSKTTTDLAENSKQLMEQVSLVDVVKVNQASFVLADLKSVLSTGPFDKVPIYLQGPNTYKNTSAAFSFISGKQDICICIRDKIRKD